MVDIIWGRNPILEALRAGRKPQRILVAEGHKKQDDLIDSARRLMVPMQAVPVKRLDQITRGAVHQGYVAYLPERTYASIDDLLQVAEERQERPFLLILDAIQDVQNLGSLIRTAEAIGMHGVIIPEHRAAGLTGSVEKSSAGALEHIQVAQVGNLTRVIDDLKKRSIWVIGLAGEAEQNYADFDFNRPLALVIGNEGKGISRLVREHCDLLVKLPMRGKINSLNAAIAGSIVAYEAWRQRWTSST